MSTITSKTPASAVMIIENDEIRLSQYMNEIEQELIRRNDFLENEIHKYLNENKDKKKEGK